MTTTWLDVEQGSDEWKRHRMGIPTASEFHRVITPTGKPSAAAGKYMGELLAEWALGQSLEFKGNHHVMRGKALEPMARAWLEFASGENVSKCGMAVRALPQPPSGRLDTVGASPDGRFDNGRIAEIKCPSPHVHMWYVLSGGLPKDHLIQVQTQLWVTGAPACEFLSLCPDIVGAEGHQVTVDPDLDLHKKIEEQAIRFCGHLASAKRRLIEMGVEPWS